MKQVKVQYFCDRCGKEIDHGKQIFRVAIHEYDLEVDDYIGNNPFEGKDFCCQCSIDIFKFVDMRQSVLFDEDSDYVLPEMFREESNNSIVSRIIAEIDTSEKKNDDAATTEEVEHEHHCEPDPVEEDPAVEEIPPLQMPKEVIRATVKAEEAPDEFAQKQRVIKLFFESERAYSKNEIAKKTGLSYYMVSKIINDHIDGGE